jgi:hypothetical protein
MSSQEPEPASISGLGKRQLPNTARIALREVAWLLGCIAAATAFCFVAPEYGYDPVPFFTIFFYLLTGIARLFLRYFLRWLKPPR